MIRKTVVMLLMCLWSVEATADTLLLLNGRVSINQPAGLTRWPNEEFQRRIGGDDLSATIVLEDAETGLVMIVASGETLGVAYIKSLMILTVAFYHPKDPTIPKFNVRRIGGVDVMYFVSDTFRPNSNELRVSDHTVTLSDDDGFLSVVVRCGQKAIADCIIQRDQIFDSLRFGQN